VSGLLPTDYAELDSTMCELDELRPRAVITSSAWGEGGLVARRDAGQEPAGRGCHPEKILAPGRNVSSVAFPTPTSLASGPVSIICPFCALEARMQGRPLHSRGLVRVASCERHAPVNSGLEGLSPHQFGSSSEVSCPAQSTLTPAGAVDSRRSLP